MFNLWTQRKHCFFIIFPVPIDYNIILYMNYIFPLLYHNKYIINVLCIKTKSDMFILYHWITVYCLHSIWHCVGLLVSVEDSDCFILTTDADVKFTPESVEALLDLMKRDTSVGAVCARTYPLGDGPLIWYQKFEYAIGHWFQKVWIFCIRFF